MKNDTCAVLQDLMGPLMPLLLDLSSGGEAVSHASAGRHTCSMCKPCVILGLVQCLDSLVQQIQYQPALNHCYLEEQDSKVYAFGHHDGSSARPSLKDSVSACAVEHAQKGNVKSICNVPLPATSTVVVAMKDCEINDSLADQIMLQTAVRAQRNACYL